MNLRRGVYGLQDKVLAAGVNFTGLKIFMGKKNLGHPWSRCPGNAAAAHSSPQHYCAAGPVWPLPYTYALATDKEEENFAKTAKVCCEGAHPFLAL